MILTSSVLLPVMAAELGQASQPLRQLLWRVIIETVFEELAVNLVTDFPWQLIRGAEANSERIV